MRIRASLLLFAAALALAAPGATAQGEAVPGDRPKVQNLPPSPQAKAFGDYLSANRAASDHDLADAARFYQAALARDPGNPDILKHAFLFAAAAGEIDQAAKLAQEVVKLVPDDRIARLTLAVAAMKAGDWDEASTQLGQSASGAYSSLTLTLLQAWTHQARGDMAGAVKLLAEIPNDGGAVALSHFESATMSDLAGQDAQAERDYKAALFASGPSPREVQAYGRFLERAGRTADATSFYETFKDRPSIQPIVKEAKARIASGIKPPRLIGSARAGAAESLFDIAASLNDPSNADIAILLLRLGLYLEPDLDLAKIVLADRFEALGRYDDAIAAYDSIDAGSAFKTAAVTQAALDRTRIGKTDAAIADLKTITAGQPDNAGAWTALGDAYRNKSDYAAAADAYSHALAAIPKIDDKVWPLFYARGVCEQQDNKWSLAEADFKRALRLSPDQPEVLNYLGYSWVDRGENLSQAVAMLEKARALSPDDGYIVDSVGWAYYRLGRYKEATAALEKAVQLIPGDPTINNHLGDAYWRIGRKLEAQFQWDHALFFGAADGEKDEIEKKLKDGLPPAKPVR